MNRHDLQLARYTQHAQHAPRDCDWDIPDSEFPTRGEVSEKLRYLLRYAVLAPSNRNSQPWYFILDRDRVHLYADLDRRLPVVDADNRELTISCGAALFHLRVALRHYGFAGGIKMLPDPDDHEWLAEIRLGKRVTPSVEDEMLFHAIARRRTYREEFEARSVPRALLSVLQQAAESEGAHMRIIEDEATRNAAGELVEQGDFIQRSHRLFVRELTTLFKARLGEHVQETVMGHTIGLGMGKAAMSEVWQAALEQEHWDKASASRNHTLALRAPVLAVLETDDDTPRAWLSAGQALDRVLLRACAEGVYASYLNQPIQVPKLRPLLRDAVGTLATPQQMLRMGFVSDSDIPPTPRRPISAVVIRVNQASEWRSIFDD